MKAIYLAAAIACLLLSAEAPTRAPAIAITGTSSGAISWNVALFATRVTGTTTSTSPSGIVVVATTASTGIAIGTIAWNMTDLREKGGRNKS